MIEHEKLLKSKNSALRVKQTAIDNLNQEGYQYQQKIERLEIALSKSDRAIIGVFVGSIVASLFLFITIDVFSRNSWWGIIPLWLFAYFAYVSAARAKIIPDYFKLLD